MNTAPPAPDPRVPRRRRRWLLGLVVCLSCLFVVVEAFGRSDWLSEAVGREIAPLAREFLGLDAVLGRLEVQQLCKNTVLRMRFSIVENVGTPSEALTSFFLFITS